MGRLINVQWSIQSTEDWVLRDADCPAYFAQCSAMWGLVGASFERMGEDLNAIVIDVSDLIVTSVLNYERNDGATIDWGDPSIAAAYARHVAARAVPA